MLDTNIILIGPMSAGKSTVARLLGEALSLPWVELDDLRKVYYAEMGYDNDQAEQIRQESGTETLLAYWKPYEIHSVERLIEDYPKGYVLAFGAGQSVYDGAYFERAQKALAAFPYVILLLPSADADESARTLTARFRAEHPEFPAAFIEQIAQINRAMIEHPANARLATLTVYTDGKSPADTRDEIIAALRLKDGSRN